MAAPDTTSSSYEFSPPTIVAGALTLTAALAWNETAKAGIRALYPGPDEGSFHATLVYAIAVTALIVAIFYIIRAAARVAKKVKNASMTSAPQRRAPGPRRPKGDACAGHLSPPHRSIATAVGMQAW